LPVTRRLKDEGYTLKELIKILGISKKTVCRYLNRISAPDCAHPERGSSLDENKKIIKEEL
jgi:transposase